MWQVIGQDRAVGLLKRSLIEERLGHAYLFLGPPHVGKMTLALDLAQALNCPEPEPPCGECSVCRRIAQGKHPDVQVIRVVSDSAEGRLKTEIGIVQIKEMQAWAWLPPFEGRHKVFIIDGAEYLSTEAANCLLKTLEEPPPRVLMVLLAASDRLLLPTVVSRCQRLELTPLPAATVEEVVLQARGYDPEKNQLLARLCRGCLGWALTADDRILEQRSQYLARLLNLANGNREQRFAFAGQLADQFSRDRASALEVLSLWLGWWRDLLLLRAGGAAFITNIDQKTTLSHQAQGYSLGQIKDFIYSIQQAVEQLLQNANPRLALEVLMLNLPKPNSKVS